MGNSESARSSRVPRTASEKKTTNTANKIARGPHPNEAAVEKSLRPHLCSIAEQLLSRAGDLASHTADAVLKVIPAYHDVPWEQVRDQALTNIKRAASTLIAGAVPSPSQVNEASVADIRAAQGVPVHDVLHAYRLSLALIKDELTEIGQEADRDAVIIAIYLLWETADVVADQLAVHHQEAEVRAARRDERFTLDTLTRILSGTISTAELRKSAAHVGLPFEGSMYVIRCWAPERENLLALRQSLSRKAAAEESSPPFLGLIDGQLSGMVKESPSHMGESITVGVAQASGLKQVPNAWVEATQALSTALAFGLTGRYSFSDLALRSVVASQAEVGRLLWDRYFSEIPRGSVQYQQIVDSISALYEHGMSINRASVAMNIHSNTLRHRLKRFEDKSGCHLGDFETVMELWWAIQYDRTRSTDLHKSNSLAIESSAD